MRLTLLSARKDLLRYLSDPMGILSWIGIPLLILLVMTLAFGTSGSPRPRGVLLIADQDDSLLSRALQMAFQQGPLAEMFQVEKSDEAAARRRLLDDRASALIVIPKNFGSAVLANERTELKLVKNPAQRILPAIAEEMLVIVADAVYYVHQVAGEPLRRLAQMNDKPAEADVVAVSLAFNRVAESLRPYLNPPRIELLSEVREKEQKQAEFSLIQLMCPGLLFTGALFIARGLAGDHWDEKEAGTLRRLRASGGSLLAHLTGKLAAAGAIYAIINAIALPAAFALSGVQWKFAPVTYFWLIAGGMGLYTLMSVLQTLPPARMPADILSMLVLFPLAMLGGGFFPLAIMPPSIASIGRWTPVGWAIERLMSAWAGASLLLPLFVVVVFSSLCFALAYQRLRGKA